MNSAHIASHRRASHHRATGRRATDGGSGQDAMYVGRVGALAVALGIGTLAIGTGLASAPIAYADTGSSASSAPSDGAPQGASAKGAAQSSRQATAPSSRNRSSSANRTPNVPSSAVSQVPSAAAVSQKLTPSVSIANVQPAVAPAATSISRVVTVAVAPATAELPAAAAVTSSSSKAAVNQSVSAAASVTSSASKAAANPFANLIAGLLSALSGGSAATTTSSSSTQTASAAATTTTATGAGGTGNTSVEGESLSVTPTKAAAKVSDNAASGRQALKLNTNGTASTTVTVPAFSSVVVRARGDQFLGAPTMVVSVDGKVVATTQVTATSWTDYTIPVSGLAGKHTISVAYTNDLSLGIFGDRNLYIDKLTVVAAPVVPTPPTTDPGDAEERPFFDDADWLWNPIDSATKTAANSATWVKYFSEKGAAHAALLYQYAVTIVHANQITSTTPRYDVKFTEKWGADPFGTRTVGMPKGTRVPPGSDGHVVVMDEANNTVYGFWQAKYTSSTDTWSSSWGGMTSMSGNGIDAAGGSATATGISRAAGVITTSEFAAAVAANTGVNHALAFSSDIAGINFVGPAIKSDGQNKAGVATPMPEGYRIQLDPSIDVDSIPGITAAEKVIAKTLQTYGAYLVDQGGARMAFAFEMAADATANTPGAVYTKAGLAWDYYEMGKIPWSSLRVLEA